MGGFTQRSAQPKSRIKTCKQHNNLKKFFEKLEKVNHSLPKWPCQRPILRKRLPSQGHVFATRLGYVFVIGKGNKPFISLPKGKGIKLTIAEERDKRMGVKA